MDQVSWLKRRKPGIKDANKREMPDGLWRKCEGCGEIIYHKELEKQPLDLPEVRPTTSGSRPTSTGDILIDPGSFVELLTGIESTDPLGFVDSKSYTDRDRARPRRRRGTTRPS